MLLPAGVGKQEVLGSGGPGTIRRMARARPPSSPEPRHNRLLAALPDADYQALLPALEPVELAPGMALYESGRPQPFLYFPASGIVSLLYLLEDGSSTEIALTGREGVVGVSLVMGGGATPSRAVVQIAGHAWRMRAAPMKKSFDRGGALQPLLLRFTQALLTQMTQTGVCNRHHAVDQQVCRWLLLAIDRLDSSELAMTQERIAHLLGVRREGVTEAAGKLQAARLIEYSRGRIRVLERSGLEHRVCECYAVVRAEYERLLPAAAPVIRPATVGSPRAGRS
jgi:CRP-like cAMP-binding protein